MAGATAQQPFCWLGSKPLPKESPQGYYLLVARERRWEARLVGLSCMLIYAPFELTIELGLESRMAQAPGQCWKAQVARN